MTIPIDMARYMTWDLKGQRFGRLTVLERDHSRPKGHVWWTCRCDCGNICTVQTSALLYNMQSSCGCYRRERAREVHSKN